MSDTTIKSEWIASGFNVHRSGSGMAREELWSIEGRHVSMWITSHTIFGIGRHTMYTAKIEVRDGFPKDVSIGVWPQEYIKLENAKQACEQWLKNRNEWVE